MGGGAGISLRKSQKELAMGNWLVLDILGESSKKQAFVTDWVLLGSKSNSTTGYRNHFYLEGRRNEERLKLQLVKNQELLCWARRTFDHFYDFTVFFVKLRPHYTMVLFFVSLHYQTE